MARGMGLSSQPVFALISPSSGVYLFSGPQVMDMEASPLEHWHYHKNLSVRGESLTNFYAPNITLVTQMSSNPHRGDDPPHVCEMQ